MCLRAQVPRQPPPGKMGRRGGDGRSRLGAMATDPELRPEGSVAHASTGGASPPEDRAHQRPRGGATRPRRVRRCPSGRPYCERNSCTPFRLRIQTKRFPGGCVSRTARRFAAGRLVRGRVYADTAVLRDTVEGVTPTSSTQDYQAGHAALDIAFSGSALPDERASDVGQWKWLHRTMSRCAGRDRSFPGKPAVCGGSIEASPAIELDESEQRVDHFERRRRATPIRA
jgi:hypothetical protein